MDPTPFASLDTFTKAYIECAMWSTSYGNGDRYLDQDYHYDDLAPECLAQMRMDCQSFQTDNMNDILTDLHHAGFDFWLTRNGHGAGFWDGDWPEPQASRLTTNAKKFGTVDLIVGDDNKIHHYPPPR